MKKQALISILVLYGLGLASCKEPASPLFQSLDPKKTRVDFVNTAMESDSLNILDYLYYYNGAGVAIADFDLDGLEDIYFTANRRGGNRLYRNTGNLVFEDITKQAGVAGTADWHTGVTVADVNGDGWPDIYVSAVSGKLGLTGKNQLYINTQNGGFIDSAAAYGLDYTGFSTQAAFFDYDQDGDLDCYLLNQSAHSVEMYGDTSRRQRPDSLAGDRLYRNDRNSEAGRFVNVSRQAGIYSSALGYGLGLAIADFNNDGWEDIYVGNDFHENDYYYLNQGDGSFLESGRQHFRHYSRFSMGNDAADLDNDGNIDLVTADMLPAEEKYLKTYGAGDGLDVYHYTLARNGFQEQFSRNCLQHNEGDGMLFTEQGLYAGIAATDWSWSPLLADFDNDGLKDIFLTTGIRKRPVDLDYMRFIAAPNIRRSLDRGYLLDSLAINQMPDGAAPNVFFKGAANGRFSRMEESWEAGEPDYANGAAYADLDQDGWLDLVINRQGQQAVLLKNTGIPNRNSLTIRLKGPAGNTQGIGTKLFVYANKEKQFQQVMLTRGFQSSSSAYLHFGLNSATGADSVLVIWPDRHVQHLGPVAAGKTLVLDWEAAVPGNLPEKKQRNNFVESLPVTDVPNWKHQENPFNDFDQQRLLPHLLSTRGPQLARADINGDGLEDFFAGGAAGQAGALFLQQKDGSFKQLFSAALQADADAEDVGAVFLDADLDGDADLVVVSGGNQFFGKQERLTDRLYLNDGSGNFTRSPQALPALYSNKSVVCTADIDRDGDADLFIGVQADPLAYGLPQTSYLLLNDGSGNFKVAYPVGLPLKAMGMVTTACFSDLNNDQWPDLVVAGEWMPVQVWINGKERWRRGTVTGGAGLWQSLQVADLDADGLPDLLAGNLGLNSKWKASTARPMRLYVKDIDGNGQVDPILSYWNGNQEYSFLGKDELESQLPLMKKKYLHYRDFATQTLSEVFGKDLEGSLLLEITNLSSGIFYNKGGGHFEFAALPAAAQLAPVFALEVTDVNQDGTSDLLLGGNWYGVSPFEGRYDANPGLVLLNEGSRRFSSEPVNYTGGWRLPGEARSILSIPTTAGLVYIAGINNDRLYFFRRH